MTATSRRETASMNLIDVGVDSPQRRLEMARSSDPLKPKGFFDMTTLVCSLGSVDVYVVLLFEADM